MEESSISHLSCSVSKQAIENSIRQAYESYGAHVHSLRLTNFPLARVATVCLSVYSPIICKTRFLLLLRTSNSMKTICCHVPRVSLPLTNGTVMLGPIKEALTCEWPFPSCHLFSCSYISFLGAKRSKIFGRSIRSPGSYSIVVSAPVDPGTKTVTMPFFSLLSLTASVTLRVTSRISPSPLV